MVKLIESLFDRGIALLLAVLSVINFLFGRYEFAMFMMLTGIFVLLYGQLKIQEEKLIE